MLYAHSDFQDLTSGRKQVPKIDVKQSQSLIARSRAEGDTFENRLSYLMASRQAAIDQCLRIPECADSDEPRLLWSVSVGVADEQKAMVLVPLVPRELSASDFLSMRAVTVTPERTEFTDPQDVSLAIYDSVNMHDLATHYESSQIKRLGTMVSLSWFKRPESDSMLSEKLRIGTGPIVPYIEWYNEVLLKLQNSGKLLPFSNL
ncbi:MAG: hypothetical protein M1829_001409 [Trizodia sp. TS-e1964]|nr:MAG: hypothetical protein M1829_001409 [Trizodia sp. TS-e1964]